MATLSKNNSEQLVVIGKITTVYGVQGWVKIYSFTSPIDNLFSYRNCYVQRNGQWKAIAFKEGKRHGKGLVSRIVGVEDREEARLYSQCNIAVPASDMAYLEEGDYYWHQLEGLKVIASSSDNPQPQLLGKVDHLIETGSNDVLVVRKCEGSIDKRERLIPYVPGEFVQAVDLAAGEIRVDWDPDF